MAQSADTDFKDNAFQIFVKIDGVSNIKTQTLTISSNDSVQSVITKIQKKLRGPSVITYKLKFGMGYLKPSKLINNYDIHDGSTLVAVVSSTLMNSSKIIDQINDISQSIDMMVNNNKDKLLMCQSLNELQDAIKSLSTQQIKQSQATKLSFYHQIYSNNEHKMEREVKMKQITQNKINKIDTLNREINAEIFELQRKKQQNLRKKDEFISELYGIQKKCNDLRKEMKETDDSIKEIEQRMKAFSYDDLVQSKLKEYEMNFDEWTTNEVISWIKLIENRKFSDGKYLPLIAEIERFGICGISLSQLNNPLCLKVIGLSDNEREMLLRNIDRVIYTPNDEEKESDVCTICAGRKINCVFIPCGHQSICFQCYQRSQQHFGTCPVCRHPITQTIKTFMNGF